MATLKGTNSASCSTEVAPNNFTKPERIPAFEKIIYLHMICYIDTRGHTVRYALFFNNSVKKDCDGYFIFGTRNS